MNSATRNPATAALSRFRKPWLWWPPPISSVPCRLRETRNAQALLNADSTGSEPTPFQALRLGNWEQFPFTDGDHRFGPIGHLQGLENGSNVILDCRLSQVENAADCLVALSLHHKREDVELPFGQSKIGWLWQWRARRKRLCSPR